MQIGLAPITLSIEPELGKTGHRVELDPADILTMARRYRQSRRRTARRLRGSRLRARCRVTSGR